MKLFRKRLQAVVVVLTAIAAGLMLACVEQGGEGNDTNEDTDSNEELTFSDGVKGADGPIDPQPYTDVEGTLTIIIGIPSNKTLNFCIKDTCYLLGYGTSCVWNGIDLQYECTLADPGGDMDQALLHREWVAEPA